MVHLGDRRLFLLLLHPGILRPIHERLCIRDLAGPQQHSR